MAISQCPLYQTMFLVRCIKPCFLCDNTGVRELGLHALFMELNAVEMRHVTPRSIHPFVDALRELPVPIETTEQLRQSLNGEQICGRLRAALDAFSPTMLRNLKAILEIREVRGEK